MKYCVYVSLFGIIDEHMIQCNHAHVSSIQTHMFTLYVGFWSSITNNELLLEHRACMLHRAKVVSVFQVP